MSHRVCSRCGAPLPVSDAASQRCEFCGVENELTRAVPAPPPGFLAPSFEPPPQQPPTSANPAVFVVFTILLVLGGVSAAFFTATSGSSSTVSSVTPPGVPPGSTGEPPVSVSALHTTPLTWMASVTIDAPGRVGALERFDPLANWEWAQSIGTAWWSDAKLFQLTADPIEKDGTVDLTGPSVSSIPPKVEYHFISQDCRASEKTRAETERAFKGSSCSLALEVDGAHVTVRLDLIAMDQGGEAKPVPLPACSIAQAFAYLHAAHKLTPRPAYALRLVNDAFGYNYAVSAGQGSASMDGVDLSPTFCVKAAPNGTALATAATAAVPVPTTPPTTAVAEGPPFDRAAAVKALKGAGIDACRASADSAPFRVAVVFQPNGNVSSAQVTDANAGTPVAACAAQKARAVHVPPFGGSPVTMSVAFTR